MSKADIAFLVIDASIMLNAWAQRGKELSGWYATAGVFAAIGASFIIAGCTIEKSR